MDTTNIQSPAVAPTERGVYSDQSSATAVVSTAPAAAATPTLAMPNTVAAAAPATASPVVPMLSPGTHSSEFYLALVVVAIIVAALWAGKVDPALAGALLGLIVSGYPTLRTWLKAQHLDAVADVLATHIKNSGGAAALGALAGAVADTGRAASPRPPGALGESALPETNTLPDIGARVGPQTLNSAAAAVLAALLLLPLFTGCAQTPYYVSGINGTVDTSKDGAHLAGGGVGVTISPNPYYPPPPQKGLAK